MFLVALLVGLGMPMMAQTATKSFVRDDYDNERISGKIDDVVSYNAVSGTNRTAPSVGRGGSSNNRYYLTLNAYYYSDRTQGHNNLIISSEDGYLIEKVVITAISKDYVGGTISATATKDGVSVGNPTASTSQAVITISVNGADNVEIYGTSTLNISSIQVDYVSEFTGPVDPTLEISNTTASGTDRAASVTVDGEVKLVVSGTDGAISCTGYDSSVATVTVNNKTITVKGVTGGKTTTITVNTAETSNYNAASKKVTITVNRKTDSSAELKPNSATLAIGGTTKLTFNTVSDGDKSFTSNNTNVATVDNNGNVTAKGAGTATITATAAQTSKYNKVELKATITVLNAATATVSAENATLAVGGTTQLNVTTNSNGKKTYTSSNNNVATVDDYGKVTAKSVGTATITVNIAATQTYAATSATVQITVEGPEELDGNGATVYYIRNVSTGLYIKYGGSYGMDAIEGRAAHPFKLYSKGNNVYALASIHGYFNSMYSNSSLFLDRPVGESNWKLELVENTTDVYYMHGENGYALASVGNQYGILELRKHDTKDIYQKWQLVTEEKLFKEMEGATVANPVDVTPFIKGAAFDYADHVLVTNKESEENAGDDPFFYNEIYDLAGNTWNSTPVASRMANGQDAERSGWTLEHSYVNNWDGFQRMQHYSAMWSDDQYAPANMNLNGIGLSRNNIHNEYVVEQYIGDLPAGTYTFSYQGFYHVRRGYILGLTSTSHSVANSEIPTMSIVTPTTETQSTTLASQQFKNYTMSHSIVTSSGANRGYEVATMFRDNRENDSYRNSIEFTLTETQPVVIRIRKPRTDVEYLEYRLQWILAFDDFTLIYKGNGSTVIDQAILYYDRVKAAYEYYSKKVSELGEPASYSTCHLEGCEHWTAWDNAINGVVTVNGLNLRGNQYSVPAQKFAYLNGTSASNKIDTEKEFLEALSKIEAAYQAAYAEHLSHATDITKETISDPSFENGGTGWTIGYDGSVATISGQTGEGLHGSKMYTTGNNGQNTWTGPVSQVLTGLEPGLYSLHASFATAGNTAYLVANGYYSGVSSSSFDTFVDHELLFLVETTQDVRIAAVGHNNPYAVDYPLYGPHYFPGSGSSFRVDNFRLKRVASLPQGRVQLALADVDAVQIDDYAKEAAYADENSLQAYRINTYADDAAAKAAVADIYARFRNTVKAQKTKNADMTYAIADPSFEHGIANAWSYSEFTSDEWGDNGIFNRQDFIFTGSTGRMVFNTWQGGNASGPISQKITGIPNGTYRVTAVMASDRNIAVLSANGVNSPNDSLYTGDNNIGKLIAVETQVTDHTLNISAEAKDGKWYKVDNFRLTFLGHKLDLDHATKNLPTYKDWYTDVNIKRPVASKKWHSFVVPFDMPVPENWDVRKLVNSTVDETGEHIFLDFSEVGEVTTMEAGVPYMVRYYPDGLPTGEQSSDTETDATIDTIFVENVDVDTEKHNDSEVSILYEHNGATAGDVSFKGTYNNTTVPSGAFYVSNNQFYVSKGGTSMKGYRGYFTIEGVNVKSIGMRTGRETGIESSKTEDVTVVGIYDVNGVRRDELSEGLNIVRMSNGTTIKMMIK